MAINLDSNVASLAVHFAFISYNLLGILLCFFVTISFILTLLIKVCSLPSTTATTKQIMLDCFNRMARERNAATAGEQHCNVHTDCARYYGG